MTTDAIVPPPAARPRRFTRPNAFREARPRDHDFFLIMVLLIWVGIVMGFGSDMLHRARAHAPPFPVIVDVHAAVFVSWLCVVTTQILLVRSGRTDLHRRLGRAAVSLFVAVAVLGPATVLTVYHLGFVGPKGGPEFMSVQLLDMLAFTVIVTAALWLRRAPHAHKRLMLLALIIIADAGFSRWWGAGLHHLLGPAANGFWGNYMGVYLDFPLLVGLMAVYDRVTRRRLHPVFVLGAAFAFSLQLAGIWLYVSPWWKPVARAIVRF
jgi:uncharacterized membrane protein